MENLADQLVTTAAQILDESGLAAVTVREVARRTGVSHGAPRRYFPTLESLHAAVAHRGLTDLATVLHAAGGTTDAWASAYVAFAMARPDTFELLFRHDDLEGAGSNLRGVSLPLLQGWCELFQGERPHCTKTDAITAWTGIHGIATLSARRALDLVGADPQALLARILA
ncbi:TetR/AcrR family transcriptional regulator [Pseudoclavibacter albus]|uniref:TetR/AcrR family transcriptional regulator n=1 Tax=Pseudoclavibacter albus TaxID=272241 RepID=UPI0008262089|nr:TetR/AcrR family transcriptional regulator [Pseudoclavibacter alba]